jgi:hypothetical protein
MRRSTKPAPEWEWVRIKDRRTDSHTFELAWWSEVESAEKAVMIAGPELAGADQKRVERIKRSR